MELNSVVPVAPEGDGVALVQVRDLSKTFVQGKSIVRRILGRHPSYLRAVHDINLDIFPGETLGLVGESGCGKTTLGRCILRLYEPDSGQVLFDGVDALQAKGSQLRKLRGDMQIVFQDPYSSLNPRQTVKKTLSEACLVHDVTDKAEVDDRVDHLLEIVGLGSDVADRYPHELSGGQRQRLGLARALTVEPRFIVADEPVSALDVSIQAQVVNLLMELQERLQLTMLFITHDLRLVHFVSHRVAVMYLGSIVELGPSDDLFENPLHPYTQALLAALPKIDPRNRAQSAAIQGEPPSPVNIPHGCPFHPRCPLASEICRETEPVLEEKFGHLVACHHVN
ncbi:MAG: ABC transporter ATP-binding protein [Caldilineaceae bacterium]|jgi:oligopeptide/dipeptide ABC transporter ATP-binding protein